MRIVLVILVSALSLGGIFGMSALGLALMYRVTDALNIAYGSVIMMVGLILVSIVDKTFVGPVLALVVGPAIGAVLMLVIHITVLRPMLPKGHLTIVIVTLGVDLILVGTALVLWGADARIFDPQISGQIRAAGAVIEYQKLVLFGGVVVLTALLYGFFRYTIYGKAMIAVAEDREGAAAVGIVATRMEFLAVVVSGAIAGLAAAAIVPIITVSSNIGVSLSLTVVIAMVIGGMGSLPGAVLGGVIIGAVQAASIVYAPAWRQVGQFGVLLLVMGARGLDWRSFLRSKHLLHLLPPGIRSLTGLEPSDADAAYSQQLEG